MLIDLRNYKNDTNTAALNAFFLGILVKKLVFFFFSFSINSPLSMWFILWFLSQFCWLLHLIQYMWLSMCYFPWWWWFSVFHNLQQPLFQARNGAIFNWFTECRKDITCECCCSMYMSIRYNNMFIFKILGRFPNISFAFCIFVYVDWWIQWRHDSHGEFLLSIFTSFKPNNKMFFRQWHFCLCHENRLDLIWKRWPRVMWQ